MTTLQKIIKYLAILLAIFIIANIISAILFGTYILSNCVGLIKTQDNPKMESVEMISGEYSDVASLEIDVQATNLIIKNGEKLIAQSDDRNINCIQDKNQLLIKEKNHNWTSKPNQLIVYVPESMIFEDVKIKNGAGTIDIEDINTKNLTFEIGAGKAEIKRLNVTNSAKIDGGVGKTDILSGNINNLKLKMGIGKIILKTTIAGDSSIEAGIGELNVNLLDDFENYTLKIEKGLGTINVNGDLISDDIQIGNGINYLKIEGGIGSINVINL